MASIRDDLLAACKYHSKRKLPPGELAAILVDTPESLGKNYQEVMEFLKIVAEAGLYIVFKPAASHLHSTLIE